MNEKSVRGLCSAVILRAILDASEALDYIREHDGGDDPLVYKHSLSVYDECRRFFLSDWFVQMNPTVVDGAGMLEYIAKNPISSKYQIRGAADGVQ